MEDNGNDLNVINPSCAALTLPDLFIFPCSDTGTAIPPWARSSLPSLHVALIMILRWGGQTYYSCLSNGSGHIIIINDFIRRVSMLANVNRILIHNGKVC